MKKSLNSLHAIHQMFPQLSDSTVPAAHELWLSQYMFCALKEGATASCYIVADAFANACCSLGNEVKIKAASFFQNERNIFCHQN